MKAYLTSLDVCLFIHMFNLIYCEIMPFIVNLHVYKFMIRPIITYGSVVFRSATKINLERIPIFQNKQLLKFTRAQLNWMSASFCSL